MKKKGISVIANEESYQNLATFHDIEELNKTVRTYQEMIKKHIKRSDVQGRLISLLELLKRYSCKQIGVSYMCKNTIATKLQVSYKTVQRLMKKLADLGMVRQIPMKRKTDMLQTANAIQIIPLGFDQQEPSRSVHEMSDQKNKRHTLKQRHNNKRYNGSEPNFVSNRVPKKFSNLVACFYDNAGTIEELWRVVRCATNKLNYPLFNITEIACDAFCQLIRLVKKGQIRKSIYAVYWGIVNNYLEVQHYEELYALEEELGIDHENFNLYERALMKFQNLLSERRYQYN